MEGKSKTRTIWDGLFKWNKRKDPCFLSASMIVKRVVVGYKDVNKTSIVPQLCIKWFEVGKTTNGTQKHQKKTVCVHVLMRSLFFFLAAFVDFGGQILLLWTVNTLFTYCADTVYVLKILKIGPTVLFTHLKIILLQCFQFSVFSFSNNKLLLVRFQSDFVFTPQTAC